MNEKIEFIKVGKNEYHIKSDCPNCGYHMESYHGGSLDLPGLVYCECRFALTNEDGEYAWKDKRDSVRFESVIKDGQPATKIIHK